MMTPEISGFLDGAFLATLVALCAACLARYL